jgi:hypothetical protein
MRLSIAAIGFLALAGCHTAPPPASAGGQTTARNCTVIESRAWSAWVNRMPGPGAVATLHVEGQIDLPTPGYMAVLREGPADRSAVPTQQLILELSPPNGMVTQVVTTEAVRYQGPAIAAQYRGVAIMCGGQRIAEITDVRDVQ